MNENPNYYAIIPANVRYDKEITPNAKLLYGEITALCNKEGYCWASNNYFAELYGVTAQAISKWINILAKKGYFTLEYILDGKECKQRLIRVSTKNLGVSTKDEEGINKRLIGYQQKIKDNNTYNTISNNISNSASPSGDDELFTVDSIPEKSKKSHEKINYDKIESAYASAFSELYPNGKCVINYGSVRKRIKQLLSTLSEDDIISAINKAKGDKWIARDMGFGLMTILSDNQIQKLLNGNSGSQRQPYSQPKYRVEQGVQRVTGESKQIHVDVPEDIF